jgi:DNA-binding transcriptional LysR family regulator
MLYLTLRQHEYVVAIAREGSLAAAARALAVSQPSLSVALSQVEARLGRRLFLRRRGGPVMPTPMGRLFVAEAEVLLSLAGRLEDAEALEARRGRVTVGCHEDLAPAHLAPMLRHLRASLPGHEIEAVVDDFEGLMRGLADGRLDLAVSWDLGLDASLDRREVARVAPRAHVVPGDPLGVRTTLAELASRSLILFEEGPSIRHVLRLFASKGLRPRVAHRVRAFETMRSLAANGEGTGLAYARPPPGPTHDGRALRTVPVTDREAAESIVLIRPEGATPAPAAAAAWDHLSAPDLWSG